MNQIKANYKIRKIFYKLLLLIQHTGYISKRLQLNLYNLMELYDPTVMVDCSKQE